MKDLGERMALYTRGQVTWPDPGIGESCIMCSHFAFDRMKPQRASDGVGRCGLVAAHHGGKIKGVTFNGRRAIACPKFVLWEDSEGDDEADWRKGVKATLPVFKSARG